MNKAYYLFSFLLLLGACKQPEPANKNQVHVTGIDSTIHPGDDFFRYVNATWYDTAQIAADQSGVGSYSFMNIPQKKLLQHILDSVARIEIGKGSIEQKIGDFYASGMDTATIDKRGFDPIKPTLERINAINSVPSLMKVVAGELKTGNRSIIGFSIRPDKKNSGTNIAIFTQSGIGLPDRDYFFKTDPASVGIQDAYKKYIATLFELTGSNAATATKNAAIAYGIEKEIASSHKTRVELRDVNKNYNKVSVADLTKKQPNIDWTNLLANLDAKTDSMDVPQIAYYEKLNALLKSVPLSDWKIYLKATSIKTYATYLSKPFGDASFEFAKVLSGQSVQKPRQQIMTENVDGLLGQALGQLYVKKYFNEDAKKRVLDLVNNLQKAFENRINNLEWMSDSTKQKAKEKLYAITKKMAYPDVWRDYDKVAIERTSYFENVQAANENEYQYRLKNLNKPVDKTEWSTTPATVTAYYNPSVNEIVFPAGILQSPYFDFYADDALNYGGIGMVIGHELTHAFDDQGAQFDKNGNVKNWWTKEDYEKFKAKTGELTKLYSTFTVLDTVHVKGALTIGENTADNGGIAIAYDAFKMTDQGKDSVRIDGFTPDQRFFLSIARIWRVKTRDEFLRNYVNTNPHSPAMWRVNGPLMNFEPFYKAFNIKPGDKNYKTPEERVRIW